MSKQQRHESSPATMKAATISHFGPPSVLELHELPVPEPGEREVLIALHAAAVGSWDASMRDGSWKEGRTTFPLVIGTDGAGVVVARGSRVKRFRVGDRVYAASTENPKGGFYAQYVVAREANTARVPKRLDFPHAAAGAFPGLTALQGIARLGLRRGETVLVFGATGAVGTAAVQFAKQRGARVIATASGRAAQAVVRRLGAFAVLNVRKPNAIDELQKLAPDGLDAAIALAGGPELERCLALVRHGGHVVHPNGVEPAPRRRRGIRVQSYDASVGARDLAQLNRAIEAARLRIPIAGMYPLARAADAHRKQEEHIVGRIVLRIRPG
ncbi:MAG TPA: NADP-dependent oxidoreductase [Gemmatimonadaceae bacterium]|nr:NADP-dependent oxidoreductase [Gemmatimonadaceae bacterium]